MLVIIVSVSCLFTFSPKVIAKLKIVFITLHVLFLGLYIAHYTPDYYGTAQLQPCVKMHGSSQCHGWLLLTVIHVPHLLTVRECGTMRLFYALWS